MNPGAIASRVLGGSIAFTSIVAAFILVLAIYAYMSDVMAQSTRRISMTLIFMLFFTSAAAAALVMFPGGPPALLDFLNRLGPT